MVSSIQSLLVKRYEPMKKSIVLITYHLVAGIRRAAAHCENIKDTADRLDYIKLP